MPITFFHEVIAFYRHTNGTGFCVWVNDVNICLLVKLVNIFSQFQLTGE